VVAISCCSHTVHVLLRQGGGPLPRQGQGQNGRKRLGYQPSHVISGLARYIWGPWTVHVYDLLKD
jgi:hypothetical protein